MRSYSLCLNGDVYSNEHHCGRSVGAVRFIVMLLDLGSSRVSIVNSNTFPYRMINWNVLHVCRYILNLCLSLIRLLRC